MQRRTFRIATLWVAVLAVSACAQYPGTLVTPRSLGAPPAADGGSKLELSSLAHMSLAGLVMAPASVVAAGGGNVVAAGGGNVVAAGGGNVVAAGGGNFALGRHVLALGAEVPVAGARVFLADLTGAPLPGYEAVVSDANGRYSFQSLPTQAPYMVVATFHTVHGQNASLRTLGQAGHDEAVKVLSVA
jgi:hypothetical protein